MVGQINLKGFQSLCVDFVSGFVWRAGCDMGKRQLFVPWSRLNLIIYLFIRRYLRVLLHGQHMPALVTLLGFPSLSPNAAIRGYISSKRGHHCVAKESDSSSHDGPITVFDMNTYTLPKYMFYGILYMRLRILGLNHMKLDYIICFSFPTFGVTVWVV